MWWLAIKIGVPRTESAKDKTSDTARQMNDVRPKPGTATAWLIACLGVLVLLGHLAASFAYSNWAWGFNHYFFFSRTWSSIIVVAGCILCLPWVWTGILRLQERLPRTSKPLRLSPQAVDVITAGLVCFLFWFLRTPQHFLGDGRFLIHTLDHGAWFNPSEPLDRWIHYRVLQFTRHLWNWDAERVYAVLSVGAGAVYVLAALRIGAVLGRKLFVAAFLLTLGSVQLFFGYAESYSLATSAMLVYFALALEYLAGARRLAWAGVALLIGVALHKALVFLVPSFLYLVVSGCGKGGKGRAWSVRSIIQGAGFLVLLLVVFLMTSGGSKGLQTSGMIVPFLPNPISQYTLLSWKHLVDFVNEQILISPLGWVIAGLFTFAFWKNVTLRRSCRFRLLFVAAAVATGFAFLLRPGLGGSRDWDLWSMASLPYAVAVACWIAAGLNERAELRYAAYVLVIVGLFHILPWVTVNRSSQLSLDHYSRMVGDNSLWPDKRIAVSRNDLAFFYWDRQDFTKAASLFAGAVAKDPETGQYWRMLGVTYVALGKIKEAEAALRRATELDSSDVSTRTDLGRLYLGLGRLPEAETVLKRALNSDPACGPAHLYLGQLYRRRGEMDEALREYLQAAKASSPELGYWYELAMAFEELPGGAKEAREAWKRVAALSQADRSKSGILEEARKRIEASE